MKKTLHLGNSAEVLKQYPDNYFSSAVMDSPYLLDFLGKEWDANDSDMRPVFRECFRVLKPGAYLLNFSATRTYHKMATQVEESGFDIKDMIAWHYLSGFPKGGNVGRKIQKHLGVEEYGEPFDTTKNSGFGMLDHARIKAGVEWSTKQKEVSQITITSEQAQQWDDWSTSLKPASEPIVVARKPTGLTTVENCLTHGVGAMNIGACRIPYTNGEVPNTYNDEKNGTFPHSGGKPKNGKPSAGKRTASFFDGIEGDTQSGGDGSGDWTANDSGRWPSNVIGEIKGYEKFFYCPKVSAAERSLHMEQELKPFAGLRAAKKNQAGDMMQAIEALNDKIDAGTDKKMANTHPTMKPVTLMRYLCRLVTPKDGIVLDPFMGSGSTGVAAAREGFDFVGIEMNEQYYEIADQRVSIEYDAPANNLFD